MQGIGGASETCEKEELAMGSTGGDPQSEAAIKHLLDEHHSACSSQ